ncbi:CMRF35-like molecule 5 isoform X2 [Salmo salar]|uniref:CMRF35-like molecule 5 isoform X2 n=1 Tax=Salmo salar TaxID=8030 RepID=A0ABM3E3K2_SALSA|nr:CMRF35-like molecule 5 isoform X2 [Salmo salar]
MKIFHVVSCCLLSALCVVESVITKATGVVGGQVTIQCSYADKRFGKSNGKYFCSKKCDSYNDILVQTQKNKNYIEKGRYTIHDKRNGDFTVTIKNLVKSDSGTYWCGVDRSIKDSYQEVDLTVTDAPPKPSTVTSKPHVTTTFIPSGDISVGPSQTAGTSVVIIVCVSLAVLVFAVIPLIFYRCWHSNKALGAISNRPDAGSTGEDEESRYSTQNAVDPRPVSKADPACIAHDPALYQSAYQALEHKALDIYRSLDDVTATDSE